MPAQTHRLIANGDHFGSEGMVINIGGGDLNSTICCSSASSKDKIGARIPRRWRGIQVAQ